MEKKLLINIFIIANIIFLEIKNQNVLEKKGLAVGPLNLKKCEFLKPKVIDDTQLTKSTFANMALDHCNETKVKNLKT